MDLCSAWREKERRREEEERERKRQKELERTKRFEQEREEGEKVQPSKWDRRAAAKAEAIIAGSMWTLCEWDIGVAFFNMSCPLHTAYNPFSSNPSKQMRYEAFLKGKTKFAGVYKRRVKAVPSVSLLLIGFCPLIQRE